MKTQTLFASIIFLSLCFNLAAQNIGVGTPNPDFTLDVAGQVGINDFIYHNDNDENTFLGFPNNDALVIQLGGKRFLSGDGILGEMAINPMADGVTFVIFADSYQHLIHADPVNARVGVGTPNPLYILDVAGDFRVFGDSYQHLLYVDVSTGRVGINEPNPQFDLDVKGKVNAERLSLNGQDVFSRFQSGRIPMLGFDNSNGLTTIQITFDQPFQNIPKVVTTFRSGPADPDVVVNLTVREVTYDYAKVILYRVDSENPVLGGEINWMAWD